MWPFVSFYIYWYSICKTKTEKKLKSLAWKYRIGSLADHCGSRGRRRFQQTHQAIGCIKNYWSVSRIKSSYNCKWNKLGTQHYKILLFLLYMRKRQGVLKLCNALVNWQILIIDYSFELKRPKFSLFVFFNRFPNATFPYSYFYSQISINVSNFSFLFHFTWNRLFLLFSSYGELARSWGKLIHLRMSDFWPAI